MNFEPTISKFKVMSSFSHVGWLTNPPSSKHFHTVNYQICLQSQIENYKTLVEAHKTEIRTLVGWHNEKIDEKIDNAKFERIIGKILNDCENESSERTKEWTKESIADLDSAFMKFQIDNSILNKLLLNESKIKWNE